MIVTERTRLSLHFRSFPGWEPLRAQVASALGVPLAQVRGLTEDADPAVRLEALAHVSGLQLTVEFYIDPTRADVPAVAALARTLAGRLGVDAAYHDGSRSPYGYVLVRPDGRRFAASEIVDDSDGLHLDESAEGLTPIP